MVTHSQAGDGLWPTAKQLDLIKASLWTGNDALEAWLRWQSHDELARNLDPMTYRLLPMLYCNMQHQCDDAEMLRLKGLYRNAWYLNNRLLHTLQPLLNELHQAGFRLLFLKGVALAHNVYPKLGCRLMNDIDVMVPLEQADAVVQWMDQRGYQRHWSQQQGGTEHRHSLPYQYDGQELDIHWHLLRDCDDPRLSALLWQHAEPFEYNGIHAWTLAPTEMLFHQLLHGLRWNEEPALRWIPDAWMIIHQQPHRLDWHRLIRLCEQLAFCERCGQGLRFLRDELQAEVPDWVLVRLSASGGTLVERMERTYVLKDHRQLYAHPLGKLWITFTDYQSQGKRRRFFPHLYGFSHFLVRRWRLPGRIALLSAVGRGSWRRLVVAAKRLAGKGLAGRGESQ